ncbi:MAG: HupE/UreJ family protein, partial [Pseudomonadota bacterium]|nr:HupE/UreJ family protein [Pseudomonadota bacterium]
MRFLIALLLSGLACVAQADIFRPAYLELREAGEDRYEVMWKTPMLGDSRLPVDLRFPVGTTSITEPQGQIGDGAFVERWTIHRAGGLAGQTMGIDGIAGGITDVIVRIERLDGTSQVEHLLPQRPEFVIQGTTSAWQVAGSYLVLGIEHILGGIDHLLFVLALLLIVRGARPIILTITAFTVAHSITLVAATLGWVTVPGPPVEAIIALSIVFVAAEAVHGLQGRPGLTARAPWVVAFSFGLLHGFGFAGALAEV